MKLFIILFLLIFITACSTDIKDVKKWESEKNYFELSKSFKNIVENLIFKDKNDEILFISHVEPLLNNDNTQYRIDNYLREFISKNNFQKTENLQKNYDKIKNIIINELIRLKYNIKFSETEIKMFLNNSTDIMNINKLIILLDKSDAATTNRIYKSIIFDYELSANKKIDFVVALKGTNDKSILNHDSLLVLLKHLKDIEEERISIDLQKRDNKTEIEKLKGRFDELKNVTFLVGKIVASVGAYKFGTNGYEVIDGQGRRSILDTVETVFSSKGNFALPVTFIDIVSVKTKDGFTQDWPYFLEAPKGQFDEKNEIYNKIFKLENEIKITDKLSNELISKIDNIEVELKNLFGNYGGTSNIPSNTSSIAKSNSFENTDNLLKIHRLKIGITTDDITRNFPLLDNNWKNDIFYENGKRYLRSLYINNDICNKTFPNENIEFITIEFKDFKIYSFGFKYKSDITNPEEFAAHISNKYNLPNNWFKNKDESLNTCCREMIYNGFELVVGVYPDGRDFPFFNISPKGYVYGDEFK